MAGRYLESQKTIWTELYSYFKERNFWIGYSVSLIGAVIILLSTRNRIFYPGIYIGIIIALIGLAIAGYYRYLAAKRAAKASEKYYPQSERAKTIGRIITYIIIALIVIGSTIYALYTS